MNLFDEPNFSINQNYLFCCLLNSCRKVLCTILAKLNFTLSEEANFYNLAISLFMTLRKY